MNLVAALKAIVNDPVELTSITYPSAVLVLVLFTYRRTIHPALVNLPNPLSKNISEGTYGVLILLIVTLIVSIIVRRVSHDLLNLIYNKFYRDTKRKGNDTHYKRVKDIGILTNDELASQYEDALEYLRRYGHPAVEKVKSLQINSKLSRSTSLILFLVVVILFINANVNAVSVAVCVALSAFMLYNFFKERWEASELVYKSRIELYNRDLQHREAEVPQ